jgi:hypothetical protein
LGLLHRDPTPPQGLQHLLNGALVRDVDAAFAPSYPFLEKRGDGTVPLLGSAIK